MPQLIRHIILLSLLFTTTCKSAFSQDEERTQVQIRTELGNMTVELYNETPQHRDNFLKLVKEEYYDSLLFHRIIPAFMVQGGDPDSKNAKAWEPLGMNGPGYTLAPEIHPGPFHRKGALAAAREPDQEAGEKRSNGSQFYLVQGKKYTPGELDLLAERMALRNPGFSFNDAQRKAYSKIGGAPHLDGGYTVFGQVIEGFDVIDKLADLECDGQDRPIQDVRMFITPIR